MNASFYIIEKPHEESPDGTNNGFRPILAKSIWSRCVLDKNKKYI